MKKNYLFSLAAIVALFSLTGCQKNNDQGNYDKYVTLGDYTDMTVDRVITTVSDEEIQDEIQNTLYMDADYIDITDRGAQEGDTVNIDYKGTIDGKEFEGGSDTEFDLDLGSETFLPDFENGIIGMNVGETKEIQVTFPEDYDGELDGKTADFSITVNSITEIKLPEYNDAYVKENYGFDTTADFEASMKEDLQAQYDEDAQYTANADALYMAIDNASFDGYPQDLYDSKKAQVEADNQAFAEQLGIEWTDLVGEDYDIDEDVISAIHEEMVVNAIAEKEKLSVTDEELSAYIDDNWELYEYDSRDDFVNDYGEDYIRYYLLYDKVLTFLEEHNTFNDVDASELYSDEDFLDDIEFDTDETAE